MVGVVPEGGALVNHIDGVQWHQKGVRVIKGLKGLELFVFHDGVCGGWDGEEGCTSDLEVEGVSARQTLKKARLQGEVIWGVVPYVPYTY